MRVVIIAEAGVNHNGSLKIAKKLVDVAKLARADYVKFQSFTHDKLVTKNAPKANYQKSNFNTKENQNSMLQKLQLSSLDHLKLINYCKDKKINFLSTAFDIDNLKFLLKNKIDFIKIPSGEITNLPYLRCIGRYGKLVILSTGMANQDEIQIALNVLEQAGTSRKSITVLHCNTEYPTPMIDVNLRAMLTIRDAFDVKY